MKHLSIQNFFNTLSGNSGLGGRYHKLAEPPLNLIDLKFKDDLETI